MGRAGVSPEDLYNLALVSDPVMTPDGLPLFVLTTLERDSYRSRIYSVRHARPRLLAGGLEESYTCPKPGPDGSIAVIYTRGPPRKGRSGIALLDPDTGAVTRVWEPEGKRILGVEWAGPDLLAVSVLDAPEGWKPYEERDFLDINRLPFWADATGWVFDRRTSIYIVRVPQGRAVRVTPENIDAYPFAATLDGWIIYGAHRYELSPYEADVVAHNPATGEKKLLAKRMVVTAISARETLDLVAVRGHFRERGSATHQRIYVADADTGKLSCISCDIMFNTVNSVNSDVRGPSCSSPVQWLNDDVYFPLHRAGRVDIYKAPLQGEPVEAIEAPESVVDEYFVSPKGVLYTLMTPVSPKELYSASQGRITSFNSWLGSRGLAAPAHYVASRGEARLDYWVLMPPGSGDCDRCVPWVLYIHGGPKTSFGYGFMFEFHAIASSGIAVVYGNPRGSDGYSEEFADIRGRYGTDDYEDLLAIARDAVQRRRALSKDLKGVAGGSYGGWMTNYIITRTTEFRAAVTMRSCSNWTSFYGTSDIGWWFAEDQIGYTPWDEPGEYERVSPLFSANKVRTPTLIIHSTADYRCPMEQALQLYTALRLNRVPTRLALFPGESHGLMRSGTPRRRVARLGLIIEWLGKYLARKE